MKQLDAKPDEYRRENPETGRSEFPVDRKMCLILSIITLAVMLVMAWHFRDEAPFIGSVAMLTMGFLAGGLFTIHLRRLNW